MSFKERNREEWYFFHYGYRAGIDFQVTKELGVDDIVAGLVPEQFQGNISKGTFVYFV